MTKEEILAKKAVSAGYPNWKEYMYFAPMDEKINTIIESMDEYASSLSGSDKRAGEDKPIYALTQQGLEDMLTDFIHDNLKDNGYSTGSEEDYDKLSREQGERKEAALKIIYEGITPSTDTEGWISVEDGKPEIGKYVLVVIGKNTILKGTLTTNGWSVMFSDGQYIAGEVRPVTHWQPLPAPPTNNKNS